MTPILCAICDAPAMAPTSREWYGAADPFTTPKVCAPEGWRIVYGADCRAYVLCPACREAGEVVAAQLHAAHLAARQQALSDARAKWDATNPEPMPPWRNPVSE